MADPTTPNKGLVIPTPGSDSGSWGASLNNGTFTPLDLMLGGIASISLSAASYTIGTNLANEVQCFMVKLSGTLFANITVFSPVIGFYVVENNCTGSFTVTWQASFGSGPVGSAIVIPQGVRTWIVSDASAGARLCPTWLPQILGTLNVNFSSGDGIQFNQTSNDSTEHAVYAIFSGNGTGPQWQVNIVNGGANNVAHFKEYIGNTLIRDQTTASTRLLLPLDFAEVGSVPSAPPSSTVRVYGVGSDFLAIQQPSGTVFTVGMPPTVQRFTSGSGTYVPSTGVVRIEVRMCGGGGGGAGTGGSPAAGGTTSFGSWTAIGGNPGPVGSLFGGTGGTGGSNGTGTLLERTPGGSGIVGCAIRVGTYAPSNFAPGGGSRFGMGDNAGGGTLPPGCGGTGSQAGAANANGTGGGGAGEYCEFLVTGSGSLSYSVGGGGTAGTGGFNGQGGIIIVKEFYS